MKKRIAILTLLPFLYSLPALAQEDTASTRVIPLHNVSARSAAQQILKLMPLDKPGDHPQSRLLSLLTDEKSNSLVVTAEDRTLQEVLAQTRLLDVPPPKSPSHFQRIDISPLPQRDAFAVSPRQPIPLDLDSADLPLTSIRLNIRVIRLVHESNGALKIETISKPTLMTLDGHSATITISSGKTGYSVEITPQINEDGSLLLRGKMSIGSSMKAENTDVVDNGETRQLLGVTDSTNKAIQRAVQHGELSVGGMEKHTDYFLQVTPIYDPTDPLQDMLP